MNAPRSIPTSPTRGRPHRGAFTLVEVMLAVVLASLVAITAFGMFAALQRSNRYNEDRLQSSSELAMTHRAVEMSMRTLILSNTRPPSPQNSALAAASSTDNDDAAADMPYERPRIILAPDKSVPPMLWRDGDGRVVQLDAQLLELTLERPPVFTEPLPGETFIPNVNRIYASRRARDRDNRNERRRAEREEREQESPRERREDELTQSEEGGEPAIAAGVRGAFGLTWEPDAPRPGELPNPDGGSWSLWWRTLPPTTDVDNPERTEGLSLDEIDRNPMYRPVRLASRLRWVRWEAVRGGETVSALQSVWWEDLPAYMTLEIQTVGGKWSKWMFEVQGSRGPEPGTITGREEIEDNTPANLPEDAIPNISGASGAPGRERPGSNSRSRERGNR